MERWWWRSWHTGTIVIAIADCVEGEKVVLGLWDLVSVNWALQIKAASNSFSDDVACLRGSTNAIAKETNPFVRSSTWGHIVLNRKF